MAERSHLSIGEVLSLLREEFPDVTISKIRFLESQGLVDPERTPSGYRKFYDHDVERLRWILRQQREHFLPLKVIRGRLDNPDEDDGLDAVMELPGLEAHPLAAADPPPVRTTARPQPPGDEVHPVAARTAVDGGDRTVSAPIAAVVPAVVAAPVVAAPAPRSRPADERPRPAPVAPAPPVPSRRHEAAARPTSAPAPTGARATTDQTVAEAASDASDSYSAEELAAAAGTTTTLVTELKQYGLINAHAVVAGTAYFDDAALAVALVASRFASHGVEVRHLRAWRNAADREASLFEQVVLPLLRQRNPQSRRQAADTLTDLARLGGELRGALVEQAIHEIR